MLKINTGRFLFDFAELKSIGAIPGGGVTRPTFSDAHLEARAWFRQKAIAAGLSFGVDAAGNHSARLACSCPNAPTLLIGSHLDSIYNGGSYDGALGVMAGLEVLRTLHETGMDLPFHLEAIDFTDEEGTLIGMLGSKALAGSFQPEMLQKGVASAERIAQAFVKAGIHPAGIPNAARDPASIYGYIELHIEQGPRLYRDGIDIGVVSGIVGLGVMRVTYHGRTNHAGTTVMQERQDAGLGASALNLALREHVMQHFPGCVITVGQMAFQPGGVHVIPGEAQLSLDFRSPEREQLKRLEEEVICIIHQQADQFGLEVVIQKLVGPEPATMDARFQDAILRSAQKLGLRTFRMPSGAGHDAQSMAAVCPCGMIFVPSRAGVSHSPLEYTSDSDCVNGANVLLHSVLRLTGA